MADILLGYLINNMLIDRYQYEAWRGLSQDELREELNTAGIMNRTEFGEFSQQLAAGTVLQEEQGE
jgi:hypothetical protein